MKTPERCQWQHPSIFIVNFEQIQCIFDIITWLLVLKTKVNTKYLKYAKFAPTYIKLKICLYILQSIKESKNR